MNNPQKYKRRLILFIPLIIFVIFAVLALIRITSHNLENTSLLPNTLNDRQAPLTQLPILNIEQKSTKNTLFDTKNFKGRITLVNFWGSWCPPCRDEHPQLLTLAQDKRFDLVGINLKDNQENARRFLGAFGNPFKIIGLDTQGRTAIEWGVYGPPETFLLNREGKVIYKYIGPIMADSLEKIIMPEIEKALN